MEYKILESIGVEITHIDGAAFNNFSAGSENGVLAGVLEECKVLLQSTDTVKISTGELLIQGFRVKITFPYSITKPTNLTDIDYYLIARLVVLPTGAVTFAIQARNNDDLTQESIFKLGYGTYEIELCRFVVGPSGITGLSQTVKVLSGPSGTGGTGEGLTPEQAEKLDTIYDWYDEIQENNISGLTPDQAEKLNLLIKQYDDANYKSMTASISPSNPKYEIGSKQTITFTWSFRVNGVAAKLSSLTFNGAAIENLSQTSKQVKNISQTSTYKVAGVRADGNKETKEASTTVYFYNRYYFGSAPDPGGKDKIDLSLLKQLTDKKDWVTSRPKFTYTPTCPDDSYIWLAYPSRFGTSTFRANSFLTEFVLYEVPITNDSGYTETYYVYRSPEPGVGTIEIQVL